VEPLLEIVGLKDAFAFLGAGEDVKRSGLEVDDWSGRDANLWRDEEAAGIAFGERRNALAGIGEIDVPERSGRSAVGVEGIDAVVFGGDEKDVVFAFAGNLEIGELQRLGVNVAVDFEGKEFAELCGIDVGRSEDFFVEVSAGASVVVLSRGDLGGEE